MFKTLSYLFVSYGWSQSGGDTNILVPTFVIAPSIYTSPLTTEEFNDLVERVLSVRQSQQKADVTENLMNTIIIITNKYMVKLWFSTSVYRFALHFHEQTSVV